jgi:hypothetical protein
VVQKSLSLRVVSKMAFQAVSRALMESLVILDKIPYASDAFPLLNGGGFSAHDCQNANEMPRTDDFLSPVTIGSSDFCRFGDCSPTSIA